MRELQGEVCEREHKKVNKADRVELAYLRPICASLLEAMSPSPLQDKAVIQIYRRLKWPRAKQHRRPRVYDGLADRRLLQFQYYLLIALPVL